jgi:hypothetical protein
MAHMSMPGSPGRAMLVIPVAVSILDPGGSTLLSICTRSFGSAVGSIFAKIVVGINPQRSCTYFIISERYDGVFCIGVLLVSDGVQFGFFCIQSLYWTE